MLFEDLLSSQPLCFNLFGELQRDLALASRALAALLGEPALEVTALEFEHSPGRSERRFTDDKSAFDVFVTYTSHRGGHGFVGIEVKYAEDLDVPPARHRNRYDNVANAMGCFCPKALSRLHRKPLEQLWRDHLLAGSLLIDEGSTFEGGRFVVIYPDRNAIVARAIDAYGSCLMSVATWF